MVKKDIHHTSMLHLVLAYFGLVVLLGLTFGLSFIPMGPGLHEWANNAVAFAIAFAKAALVLFVFMEFRHAPQVGRMWAIFGIGFFVLLASLVLDYFTRDWDYKTKSWIPVGEPGSVAGSTKDGGGSYTPTFDSGRYVTPTVKK
jgi:caa(3)-type oxidase subunit IV